MSETILPPILGEGIQREGALTVRHVLELTCLREARLVAGEAGLDRAVLWSHVVDMPDPAPWVPPGYFLLTTGLSWPHSAFDRRKLIEALAARGVAGIGLAVGRYLSAFSPQERQAANRTFLPLVEIPFDVPFARVTEELHHAIMAEPYRAIERSEQIHHALMRAASGDATLDDLARILCPLIGRTVTFEDASGHVLAHCSVDARPPVPMLKALESTALGRRLRSSEQPVRVPAAERAHGEARVACPMRLGNELVGVVWVDEGATPLSELDYRAAQYAALVGAIRVAHQRELARLESALGHASMLSLLESPIGTADDAIADVTLERVRLLGYDPDASYRAAIVLLPDDAVHDRAGLARRDRLVQRLRDVLKSGGAEVLVAAVQHRVPFLLPESLSLETVVRSLGDPTLCVVAGRAYRGVGGVRRSYREALSLLRHRGRSPICTFDDVLVPRVMSGDEEARRSFIGDRIDPLLAQRGGKTLASALLAFARSGFRLRECARELAIHPNTLRYRLNRASEILHLQLTEPEVRFELQLLARLLDLTDEAPALSQTNKTAI
jgi:purine catabolism regulator